MDERKLGDVPVADIDEALRRHEVKTDPVFIFPSRFHDLRELERPPYPYVKCGECQHDEEEHDENHRCHEPGCTCGMNPW